MRFLLCFFIFSLPTVAVASTLPATEITNKITNVGNYVDAAFPIGASVGTLTLGAGVIRKMLKL